MVRGVAYDPTLPRIIDTTLAPAHRPPPQARVVRHKLRLLVCGGDGTIAWVMGVIKKLKLVPEPPVAIMPMGTGRPARGAAGSGFATARGRGFLGLWDAALLISCCSCIAAFLCRGALLLLLELVAFGHAPV